MSLETLVNAAHAAGFAMAADEDTVVLDRPVTVIRDESAFSGTLGPVAPPPVSGTARGGLFGRLTTWSLA